MTPTLRKAAEAAKEALKFYRCVCAEKCAMNAEGIFDRENQLCGLKANDALTALTAALAEQPAGASEVDTNTTIHDLSTVEDWLKSRGYNDEGMACLSAMITLRSLSAKLAEAERERDDLKRRQFTMESSGHELEHVALENLESVNALRAENERLVAQRNLIVNAIETAGTAAFTAGDINALESMHAMVRNLRNAIRDGG